MVLDDETFGMWERGRGSSNEHLDDGTKMTLFYRNAELRDQLPTAGVARFYSTAGFINQAKSTIGFGTK